MFLRHYVTAHPTALLAELDGSCRTRQTRRFLQNSTILAELDGSCRQNSTVLAELDGSCMPRQVLPFHHPFGHYGASCKLSTFEL